MLHDIAGKSRRMRFSALKAPPEMTWDNAQPFCRGYRGQAQKVRKKAVLPQLA